MKRRIFLALSGLCIVGMLMSLMLSQQSDPLPIIMDEKLAYSQELLEAIIFDDYATSEHVADELRLLSELSSWDVVRSPEYTRRSLEFRQVAVRLAELAERNNSDGLELAYVELTLECFECHRYMREVLQLKKALNIPAPGNAWLR